ncbi:MAG: hypothetical protein O3A00_19955, partial [Planctomycetota bacterium]|nr:hypothetical protein [Planctomycetota bacterium]
SLTATPLTGVTFQTISLNDVNLFVGVNGAFSETKRMIFTGSGTAPVLSQAESAAPTLVDGTLTSGNFTLSDGGTTTTDIPWAVSARDIQTALNAASAFGSDQFSVADGQQPGSKVITYLGTSDPAPVLTMSTTAPTLVNGRLTPGTFTLSGTDAGGSKTTTAIPWMVSASEIENALNASAAFGSDTFNVTDEFDTAKATGFSVTGGNLDYVSVTETGGQLRSWMGLAAEIGVMQPHGLPAGFELEARSLNLLYNGPDKTTDTRINWAGVADPVLSSRLRKITGTTNISVGGTLSLNVNDMVTGVGTFDLTKSSGLTIDDGAIELTNASELLIQLSDMELFVGVDGPATADGAVGFSVNDANFDIAIVREDAAAAAPRTWVGLAGSIGSMLPVGLPGGVEIRVNDLDVLYNSKASDDSQLNWEALSDQDGDEFGLDKTRLTELDDAIDFSVAGMMLVSIESYIYVSGAIALEKRSLDALTAGSSTPVAMSVLTFGAKDLRAFVGSGNADLDDNGIVDDVDDLDENAIGVGLTIEDLALTLMKPTAAASTKSYFALAASGSAELIGVDDVGLVGRLNVSINRGRDTSLATPSDEPAIDFAASAAASADYGDASGLKVRTGPGADDSTIIGFDDDTLEVTGYVSLSISEFVHASGKFAFEKSGSPQTVTLVDETQVDDVSILKIGASDVNVFVGSGGPYFQDNRHPDPTDPTNTDAALDGGDGVIDDFDTPDADGATGVVLTVDEFGLALLRSQTATSSFYALTAAGSAELVGVEGVTLTADNLLIQANGGDTGAVDLPATFGTDGLAVPTSDTTSVSLKYDSAILSASGTITLGINDNVEISGNVAISKGGTETATLDDGSTKEVSVVTVGGSDLSAFLGADGKGISVTGAEFGLALVTPVDERDSSRYYGLTASAESAGLVGIDGIDLSVADVAVLVNGGTDATVPNRVVDFRAGDLDHDTDTTGVTRISTGSAADNFVDLAVSEKVIKASGDVTVNLLNGLVTLSGTVAVKVNQQEIVLNDDTTLDANALEVGVFNATAAIDLEPSNPDNNNVILSGVTLGLAYYTPDTTDATDKRSWLGLKTFGGEVAAGSQGFTIGASDIAVSLNKGYGKLGTVENTTVVDFTEFDDGAVLVDTGGFSDELDEPITVRLDFDDEVESLSAEVDLVIGDYFFAHGNFSYSSGGTKTVTLADGADTASTANVTVTTLGVSDASVFVGNNGPYQQMDGMLNPNAAGFSLSGVDFVLVRMTEVVTSGTPRKWDAIYAEASSAQLVGISGFTLGAKSILVQMNTAATDGSVVDFTQSDLDGNADGKLTIDAGDQMLDIDFSSKMLQVKADVELAIDEYVFVSGTVAFKKGSTATATLSDGITKEVSVMTVAASDVDIFVGVNGPADEDGAMGLSIENVEFGMALLKPTAAGDMSSYYGLQATADSVGFVGLDPGTLQLELKGLDIQVNGGTDKTKPGRVVNFALGDLDQDGDQDGVTSIDTGSADGIDLAFTSKLIKASSADAVLTVSSFVQIHGGFAFSKSADQVVTLSDGKSKNVNVTTFGFDNVDAFVGAGPYFVDLDNDGLADADPNPDAAGLLLKGGKLAVALFKPTSKTDTSSYYAVSASLESIEMPGLDLGTSDAFMGRGYRIDVNGGSNDTAVDFTKLPGGKLTVQTSTDGSVDFDYSSTLQRASIESATLNIGDYVYLSGGFSFTRQQGLNVRLEGQTSQVAVDAYAFGAGSVDMFVGSGPYFEDNSGTPDPLNPGKNLTIPDGVIDAFDTRSEDAVG